MTHASAAAAEKFAAEMTGARSTRSFDPADPGLRDRIPPGRIVANHSSLSGASELAERIRRFWEVQGHTIEISIEHFATRGGAAYAIRSNLCDGKPPGRQ